MNTEKLVHNSIEQLKEKAFVINDYLYKNPELSGKEYLACQKYIEVLNNEGIPVEGNFLGSKTAFKATINEDSSSDIKIGILAEYDALPEIGHACGHCASGALSFLAALGLFKNKEHLKGNIYLIGTPSEEYNGFKTDMADSGVFDDFSYVIMIHMSDRNLPKSSFMALDAYNYEFFGSPSHAAASPWNGKNALNGMTLFMHALDMMRQQLRDNTRVHGIVLKGGAAANIIPDYASCQYWYRYKKKDYLEDVIRMAKDAAEGCAKATQTSVKITHASRALAELRPTPNTDVLIEQIYGELGLNIKSNEIAELGSSDIGNLSYKCPAFHPLISVSDKPVAAHTKEFAKCMETEKTKEAIEKGAKVIASLVVRSLYDESIIENMKKDFQTR
ncbi:MAG: M20 family metallopeptidase [Bacillota bacterium]